MTKSQPHRQPAATVEDLPDLVSLRVERSDHLAEVTLLGPGKGNAMGPDFWHELPLVFAALDNDPEVRAVVLTGSGSHFSYGLDLPAILPTWGEYLEPGGRASARAGLLAEIRRLQEAVNSVAETRKPVIAAVSGWCVGGGVDLISAVDVRLAEAGAKFSVREVKLAMVADLGSLQRLAPIIGEGHLRELALTGRDIDATRAEKIGLVNDVYSDSTELLAAARDLAREIAANPPLAVQGAKDVLSLNSEQQIASGLRYVATRNSAFLPSRDLGEAVEAFLQRRDPTFTGE